MFGLSKKEKFFDAIKKDDLEKVQFFLSNGLNLNEKDSKGRSALAVAYDFGSKSVIEFFRKSGKEEEPEKLYEYAVRCIEEKNFDEGIKRLEEAKTYFPEASTVYYSLGISYFKSANKFNKDESQLLDWLRTGIDYLNQSLKFANEDKKLTTHQLAEANFIIGTFYVQQKDYASAIKFLRTALENESTHTEAKKILQAAQLHSVDETKRVTIHADYLMAKVRSIIRGGALGQSLGINPQEEFDKEIRYIARKNNLELETVILIIEEGDRKKWNSNINRAGL